MTRFSFTGCRYSSYVCNVSPDIANNDPITLCVLASVGNGVNRSSTPRLVQYLNLWPDFAPQPGHRSTTNWAEDTRRRVEMYWQRHPGGCYNWPPFELPDPRARPEWRPSEPAVLTKLGQKLLGLVDWA